MKKAIGHLFAFLSCASWTTAQNVERNLRASQATTQPERTPFELKRTVAVDGNLGVTSRQTQIVGAIVVDGVKYANTTAGVNAAIAEATSSQTVVVPSSFSLSGPINMDESGVTLQCINGAHLSLANGANADIIIVTASNTRVTGCILDGNSANQTTAGYGINITPARVSHVDIDHNQIQNTWNEGIRIANASYLRIHENRLINNGDLASGPTTGHPAPSSFAIDYTMTAPSNETYITISDNDIDETASLIGGINLAANIASGVIQKWHLDRNTVTVGDNGASVELGIQAFAGALPGNIVSDGTINGNTIAGADTSNSSSWGISIGLAGVTHGNVTASGNTIRDTRATCIEGIGSGIVITGNSCDDTDGITVTTNTASISGIVVASNVLTNGSGAYQNLAQIGVSAYPRYTVRGLLVANNSIFNVPVSRACIYINGNATGQIKDSQIVGNYCQGQASGMTNHAILISQAANVAVKNNMSRDWVGPQVYGLSVGSTSTGAIVFGNSFLNTTGPWQDQGTSTLIDDLAGAPFYLFAAEANGSRIYCTNCKIANPCTTGGDGALAKRLNGIWVCE